MNRRTHIEDRDAALLAGDVAPLSRSAWADNVIAFPALTPPPWAGEDEDADCWESVGILAVRLLGTFQSPRLLVMRQDQS